MRTLDKWEVTDQPSHIDRKETGQMNQGAAGNQDFPNQSQKTMHFENVTSAYKGKASPTEVSY